MECESKTSAKIIYHSQICPLSSAGFGDGIRQRLQAPSLQPLLRIILNQLRHDERMQVIPLEGL